MSSNIQIKPIEELRDLNFFIPDFQRGYRWDKQQVEDLLADLKEYVDTEEYKHHIYCLQPLVVKRKQEAGKESLIEQIHKSQDISEIKELIRKSDEGRNCIWSVIDGQQRLTTISIIVQTLVGEKPYSIDYAVLDKSHEKVNDVSILTENDANEDINLHYMYQCKRVVEEWKQNQPEEYLNDFVGIVFKNVKVIWYENNDEEDIKIFTRLNIGRISLTNSELVKALFLNERNFSSSESIHRSELAHEWDEIEATFQNDEFWLFLQGEVRYGSSTRIDFLLKFVSDNNLMPSTQKLTDEEKKKLGNDDYRTFRYFYEVYNKHCSKKEDFVKTWDEVIKPLFQTLTEWYNDIEFYHYVGYVICLGEVSLKDLYREWRKRDRQEFLEQYLFKEIIKGKCLKNCSDINKTYKYKRDAIPLLLLHNIQTILNQNQVMKANKDYGMAVFYKFPFHLFKKENWDVEHIDSNTTNELDTENDQKEWLLNAYSCLSENKQSLMRQEMDEFFKTEGKDKVFESLKKKLLVELKLNAPKSPEEKTWKNRVYNFALLDDSTNRTYKNALFPVKRRHIIDKEMGKLKYIEWEKGELKSKEKPAKSAFVPICTNKVFQKTFSALQSDITTWTETDAEEYGNNIKETLTAVFCHYDAKGKKVTIDFIKKDSKVNLKDSVESSTPQNDSNEQQ